MPAFFPATLAQWTGGQWYREPVRPLTGFVTDSRVLRPGQVFVALRTDRRDGHDFLTAALLAGASAAIVGRVDERLLLPQLLVPDPLAALQAIGRGMRNAFSGTVVGVTGSAGKTSTKDLLSVLLGGPIRVLATEGNLNNQIGVPLTLVRLDAPTHQFAVVEAGISGPGEMEVLADLIQPDVAIVTLIGPAHLEKLGGLEGVARAKARLAAGLRPQGLLITPAEVAELPAFRELAGRRLIAEPATSAGGPRGGPDSIRFEVRDGPEVTEIDIRFRGGPVETYRLRQVSEGMARNAVLAIGAALEIGVRPDVLQLRLSTWMPTALRAELRREGGRLLYVDCYNANPASMRNALQHFITVAPEEQPRLYVLGGMEDLGFQSAEFHRKVGNELRLRAQDRAFMIGEYAGAMCAGAMEAGNEPALIMVVDSLEPIAAQLANFQGAVFMKGSRRWELEKAIMPVSAMERSC